MMMMIWFTRVACWYQVLGSWTKLTSFSSCIIFLWPQNPYVWIAKVESCFKNPFSQGSMLIHMATIIKCDDVISEGYETETSARVPESDPGLSWMGAFVIVMMTSLTRLDLHHHHRQSLFLRDLFSLMDWTLTQQDPMWWYTEGLVQAHLRFSRNLIQCNSILGLSYNMQVKLCSSLKFDKRKHRLWCNVMVY